MNNYLKITYPKQTEYPEIFALYLFVHYLSSKTKLLDIGCGIGEYVRAFRQLNILAFGLDKRIETNPDLGYYKCDIEIEQIPFPDNYFDFIFTKSVIEHVQNIEHLFTEIYRVLKPSGKIIVMTPDWSSCYKDFYIDYTHIRPFTLKALRETLLIFGFKNVKVEKFYQLPLLWKKPYLTFLAKLTSLFINDRFKWKDKEQTQQRIWIRFSKELMLLGIGEK